MPFWNQRTASAARVAAAQATADLATTASSPRMRIADDFIGALATPAFGLGWTRVVSSGSTGATGDADHDGVVTVDTGANAAGRGGYHLASASPTVTTSIVLSAAKVSSWEYLVWLGALAGGGDRYQAFMGWSDGLGLSGDGANAVFVVYDSASSPTWLLRSVSAGVVVNVDTGIMATTDPTRWVLIVDFSAVPAAKLYVATSPNGILTATDATILAADLPVLPMCPAFKIENSLGTTVYALSVDYFAGETQYVTPR